jgi:exodeoxyribonuclease VII small subunit
MSKKKSFEDRLKKAKELLEKLKDPELTISESMKLYKEGKKELDEATKLLEEAELELEELNGDNLS